MAVKGARPISEREIAIINLLYQVTQKLWRGQKENGKKNNGFCIFREKNKNVYSHKTLVLTFSPVNKNKLVWQINRQERHQ